MSSLELIEESLDLIYRIRKANLAARMKQHDSSNQNKHKLIENKISNFNDKTKLNLISSNLKGDPINQNGSKSPVKPTSTSYTRNSKMMSDFNQIHDFNSAANASNNTPTSDMTINKEVTPILSQSRTPTTNTSNNIQDSALTNHIVITLEDFKTEINTWWSQSPSNQRSDDDVREEYADYLTEKYMCQKFDLFPSSIGITKIRKEVCKVIENFATDGYLNFIEIDKLIQANHALIMANVNSTATTNTNTNSTLIGTTTSSSSTAKSISFSPIPTRKTPSSTSTTAQKPSYTPTTTTTYPTLTLLTNNDDTEQQPDNIPTDLNTPNLSDTGTGIDNKSPQIHTTDTEAEGSKGAYNKNKVREQYNAYLKLRNGKK